MWVKAVEKAGTTDPTAVHEADHRHHRTQPLRLLFGHDAPQPSHHQLVLIGEIQDDGQFEVVWKTKSEVPGDAWSNYLPEDKNIISDWNPPIHCGHYNTKTKKCSGMTK